MERDKSTVEEDRLGSGGRACFIGIDIGTQGARVALIDLKGNLIASNEEGFLLNDQSREEQSPERWWEACIHSLKKLINTAKSQIDTEQIKAISVTSTSGTIIPLDVDYRPLHNAIMYSDKRSVEAARLCKKIAYQAPLSEVVYKNFNTSSGLSKMVWFVQTYPHQAHKLHRFVHAADYILGKLCGNWDVTDYTNALKSGYDIEQLEWPSYIYQMLPLKKNWLQQVVPSGMPLGCLLSTLANEIGLSPHVQVVAGMTDGCASQIASGAVKPGQWNTTIGTTLVVKGVTRKEILDPHGRIYNHRHPEGYSMPGGASNTGADWITADFNSRLQQLNKQAMQLIPTGNMSWPLRQQGERFPFIAPQARGFDQPGLSATEAYTANLEGVAYIERVAYEMIEQLSGEKVDAIYTAGGGSNSDVWLKIRSNVLNLPIYKMKYVTGAVGAAILAASKTHFDSLITATAGLTQIEKTIEPEKQLAAEYKRHYTKFSDILKRKGYLDAS